MPHDLELHDREVLALHRLQRARDDRDEGRATVADVTRARNAYVAAMCDRDKAAADRLAGTATGTDDAATEGTGSDSAGIAASWSAVIARENEARGLGTDTVTNDASTPDADARSGWARAVAEANSALLARHAGSGA
jgi:hypothetical protein